MSGNHCVQENAPRIVEAFVRNVIELLPYGQAPDVVEFSRAGDTLLSMVRDKSRLLPSFWTRDGKETNRVIAALDSFAELTPMLYFSLRMSPDTSVAMTLSGGPLQDIAHQALSNHQYLNRYATVSPTEAFVAGIGKWMYEIRDWEAECAQKQGRKPAVVLVATSNAS